LFLTLLPALILIALQRGRQTGPILGWAVVVAVALFLALFVLGAYEAASR
jgi:uncharacterized membrane protein